MQLIKNTKVGNLNKLKIYIIFLIFLTNFSYSQSNDDYVGNITEIKILDKISSKK